MEIILKIKLLDSSDSVLPKRKSISRKGKWNSFTHSLLWVRSRQNSPQLRPLKPLSMKLASIECTIHQGPSGLDIVSPITTWSQNALLGPSCWCFCLLSNGLAISHIDGFLLSHHNSVFFLVMLRSEARWLQTFLWKETGFWVRTRRALLQGRYSCWASGQVLLENVPPCTFGRDGYCCCWVVSINAARCPGWWCWLSFVGLPK